jgi:N-acetylmuramoyl-L-alanine amidase
MLRVQLAAGLEAWVSERETRALPPGAVAPSRVAGNARLLHDSAWVDLVIPMADRPPHAVAVEGDRLELTLFGTTGNSDIIAHRAGTQDVVRSVTATREATDRVRYVVQLTASPFGWHAFWSGSAFVLRIRRPPAVDPVRPLAGRRIVVDPGHPPLGSRGPTGLYEAVAVREVAERLARRLREAGATVVLTRTNDAPLALGQRPVLARRANGEAFVSIHLNALPDGANPFNPRLGSGTYWFHAPSAGLAQAVQAGLVSRMGLADEGTFFDNLAVVRQTWMPSVLTEGAYVMLPEHEAALRTSTFQEAYAAGIADGLAAFFRGLAR